MGERGEAWGRRRGLRETMESSNPGGGLPRPQALGQPYEAGFQERRDWQRWGFRPRSWGPGSEAWAHLSGSRGEPLPPAARSAHLPVVAAQRGRERPAAGADVLLLK